MLPFRLNDSLGRTLLLHSWLLKPLPILSRSGKWKVGASTSAEVPSSNPLSLNLFLVIRFIFSHFSLFLAGEAHVSPKPGFHFHVGFLGPLKRNKSPSEEDRRIEQSKNSHQCHQAPASAAHKLGEAPEDAQDLQRFTAKLSAYDILRLIEKTKLSLCLKCISWAQKIWNYWSAKAHSSMSIRKINV